MERRAFLATLAGGFLASRLAVEAQPAPKTARIGFLSLSPGPTPTMDISPGLRELGWIEGQNLAIEYRWAASREDQLPALAAELVRLKVDVIVTSSTPAAQAAKRATTTIPIVATFVADPVGSGLVASLARPGGNITGLTTLATGLVAKRLELLKAVVSGSTRVAVLWQPGALGERTMRDMMEETQVAGRTLALQLQFVEARRPDDFEQAFSAMREARAGGVLVFPNPILFEARRSIVAHAAKSRLPVVYPWREAASVGGFMSYSTNFPDMYRRAATYVDKILKGAKPADLPIEQPTKFELVINLKTAKALGLTIPPSLLQRADQVIE
ncbi:MAG TPA: ABC transporter substrate-binding protein [Candidatus Angelobacter sp.]|jgi:putative ABC transport system substrate-binding protein|nr:ABC transporter substrate-binding protein [Candidatus Angelobacter sp.]